MEFPWKKYNYEFPETGNTPGKIGVKKHTIDVLPGGKMKCALCSGHGILRGTADAICPVCRGKGEVNIPGPVIKCVSCRGRGSYPKGTNITCTVCRGKGYVKVTQPFELCKACSGAGRNSSSRLSCVKCSGKGVVTSKKRTVAESK